MGKRQIGIIKWFNSKEGYGFIARKRGDDLLVQHSAFLSDNGNCSPKEGDPVEFSVGNGISGNQAQEVVILDDR